MEKFSLGRGRGIKGKKEDGTTTYLICELIPYRACSSGLNMPGVMPAERSFWTPACLARRKDAIFFFSIHFLDPW